MKHTWTVVYSKKEREIGDMAFRIELQKSLGSAPDRNDTSTTGPVNSAGTRGRDITM